MAAFDIDPADVAATANADPEFSKCARYWDGVLELVSGNDTLRFRLIDGVVQPDHGNGLEPGDLRIAGARDDWENLLAPIPKPGYCDISTGRMFMVTGALTDFGPYYPALQRLVALISEHLHGPRPNTGLRPPTHRFDAAVGRYVHMPVQTSQYRVYFEEAGEGIPLLMLHTAGADGRQYRHVLESRALRRRFRMIAPDLPFHGKSIPPTDTDWWAQEYKLTRAFLIEFLDSFVDALGLETRPIFMGCSIGGLLAPDLAYYRPGRYRAVVGLNGALAMPGHMVATPDKVNSWYHPRISNEWKSSAMLGLMAPLSPEAYRRETAFVYSQGAPAVLAGDAFYYMHDHDLTAEQAAQIDTSKTAVYLLTGEYDPLAKSGMSHALADAIDGVHFEINDGVGHFGPSENPEAFLEVIEPVLATLAEQHPE